MSATTVKCFQCNAQLSDAERADGWCESCGKPLPERLRLTPEKQKRAAASGQNPWMPMQICAATFLFGAGAGGTLAGINSARMGNRESAIGSVVAGIFLFLIAAAVVVFAVPASAARPVGLIINLSLGGMFALWQWPQFKEWKDMHWRPATPGARYKPSKIGQLFLVAIAVLAVEVGIVFLMVELAPND